MFRNCLEEIELADKVGFDHVWLAEHHFTGEYNHLSAPAVMLGAIAARTKNIRVGHSIVQMMPANNHPVKVAENVATIDLISNGRMDFGVRHRRRDRTGRLLAGADRARQGRQDP